jgi:PII-like signaling protein
MSTGEALKLTTYFGERDRCDGRLVADLLLDIYERHQLRASVLLRGAAGYGPSARMRSDRLLTLSEDLPLASIAVDSRARIEAALPDVLALKRRGLLTLERARVLSASEQAEQFDAMASVTGSKEALKLTAYLGRHQRAGRVPAYRAVTELLHRSGVDGATVLLGVDGTYNGERQRARMLSANGTVPLLVVAIGAGERIAAVLPELAQMLPGPEPLLTLERVQVCKRDGQLLSHPRAIPGTDEHGFELWQKLMVHTSEAARHDGRPLHRALVRELRAAGIAGATSIRGIWGFHGEQPPHGDRLLQRRRHVPVVTIVVERPQRLAGAFAVIDELTSGGGLVTAELVPAATEFSGSPAAAPPRLARYEP